jgi:hypothetical protein
MRSIDPCIDSYYDILAAGYSNLLELVTIRVVDSFLPLFFSPSLQIYTYFLCNNLYIHRLLHLM